MYVRMHMIFNNGFSYESFKKYIRNLSNGHHIPNANLKFKRSQSIIGCRALLLFIENNVYRIL
uniref:Uncharacterized protein n=1 Tax=Octopus bimaculoides TaxID=37653 RepID=A0A0L8HKA0_OCTBM